MSSLSDDPRFLNIDILYVVRIYFLYVKLPHNILECHEQRDRIKYVIMGPILRIKWDFVAQVLSVQNSEELPCSLT